ncbi:hypothetical protein AtEden1_Chr4g0297411 [Arabidopsis thaliana]
MKKVFDLVSVHTLQDLPFYKVLVVRHCRTDPQRFPSVSSVTQSTTLLSLIQNPIYLGFHEFSALVSWKSCWDSSKTVAFWGKRFEVKEG